MCTESSPAQPSPTRSLKDTNSSLPASWYKRKTLPPPMLDIHFFYTISLKFPVRSRLINLVMYINLLSPFSGAFIRFSHVWVFRLASPFCSLCYRGQWRIVCLVDALFPHAHARPVRGWWSLWLDTQHRTLKIPVLWYLGSSPRTWCGMRLMGVGGSGSIPSTWS